MGALKWSFKEKCMSAFWLICSVAWAVAVCVQYSEVRMSASLQSLGMICLLLSWALAPQIFLQPLSLYTQKTIPKVLVVGLLGLFVFQSLSLVTRYMA